MTNYTSYTPQQAHDDITALFDAYYDAKKAGDSIPPNTRIESADAIVEHYVEINGKRPPKGVLSRLATYILLDNLTDSHPDKMTREEYPIMSKGQRKRRREIPSKNVYYCRDDFGGFRTVYEKSDEDATGYVKKYPISYRAESDISPEKIDVLTLLNNANLTDRQRDAIELVFFEGLTQQQAADWMGVTQQAVVRYLQYAYKKIRKIVVK